MGSGLSIVYTGVYGSGLSIAYTGVYGVWAVYSLHRRVWGLDCP